MNLHIDSTDNLRTIIRLDDIELVRHYDKPQDQDVLGAINQALKETSHSLSEISSITVNPGPGSFTGSRVGVSVANSLAFALGVTVNEKQPPIFPVYSQEPNITVPKNKSH